MTCYGCIKPCPDAFDNYGCKIGDKVIIKSDLKSGEDYNNVDFVEEMTKYLGKEATIVEIIYTDWQYGLDIDNNHFSWTNEMLELIEPKANKLQTQPVEIPIKVKYKNWQGQIGIRTIIPLPVHYGHTDFHSHDQWLLDVWDVEKDAQRTYALMDILEFIKE